MVILAFLNALITLGDGSLGSPSEMIMQCFTEAGALVSDRTAIFMAGSKYGMSPGVILLIRANIARRFGPTSNSPFVPPQSQASPLKFQCKTPAKSEGPSCSIADLQITFCQ